MSNPKQDWIPRPYGRKKILSDDGKTLHQTIVIEPRKNTGINASPNLLDQFGLVGHPGIFYEHIEHQGFIDGASGPEPSLKFVARALKSDEGPREFLFSKGSLFYSVQSDTNRNSDTGTGSKT